MEPIRLDSPTLTITQTENNMSSTSNYNVWYFPIVSQSAQTSNMPTLSSDSKTIVFNSSKYIILNCISLSKGTYKISFNEKYSGTGSLSDNSYKIEVLTGSKVEFSKEYSFTSNNTEKRTFNFEKTNETGSFYIRVTGCEGFNFTPLILSDQEKTVNFGHPTSPLDIYVDNSVQSKRIRIGSYPEDNNDNLFEVGCGTSESNKKNAFSIDDKGIMTSATPLIRIVHHNFSTNTTIAAGSYANFSEQFTYPGEDPSGWRCLGVACFHNGHNQMCSISGYSIYNTAWRYQSGDTQGFKICNPAEKPSVRLCLRNNAGSTSAVYNYASGNIASVDLIWGFFGIAD